MSNKSKTLDDMPVSEAITLYYEKHYALRKGDMEKLRELKAKWPILFDKAKDTELRNMIESIKTFAASERYKQLCRMELKESLSLIENEHNVELE